ncbi:MAG: hypothetical protein EBR30_03305 [Cytophagia bacterium]|nr:hypothetical protein [Cytophagia bacterium]
MSKLLITTQVYENYGAHDWDGQGECPQYWKPKGGNDYVVKNFRNFNAIGSYIMVLRDKIETNTEYFREHIIDWEIVADDYLTQFERSQLEYEGKITYSPTEVFYGR